MVTFIVPGKPQAKQRPRHTRGGHTYTPKETKLYEQKVRQCYQEQCPNTWINGPITLSVIASFLPPKSRKRHYPTIKPDIDNIVKGISDALNGVAFEDDCQVIRLYAIKEYANVEQVKVTILEVECSV